MADEAEGMRKVTEGLWKLLDLIDSTPATVQPRCTCGWVGSNHADNAVADAEGRAHHESAHPDEPWGGFGRVCPSCGWQSGRWRDGADADAELVCHRATCDESEAAK